MTNFKNIDKIIEDKRFTDTRVGTNSKYEFSNGNTLPYTGVPYGQNYMAVQTDSAKGSWWFNPHSRTFEGFRMTHQPSPWMGDFSNFIVLPFASDRKVIYNPYHSVFKPNLNIISYASGEDAYMTASRYGAYIHFESKDQVNFMLAGVGLDLQMSSGRVTGTLVNFSGCEDENFTMYIAASLDGGFTFEKVDKKHFIKANEKAATLKIATSFISPDQALVNLGNMAETFDDNLEESYQAWTKYFDKFEIEKGQYRGNYEKYENYEADDQVAFFYNCVYRSFLFPMTMYEIDEKGEEIHYDTKNKQVRPGKLYTNIGFWDGSKTLFPLLALVARDEFEDILEGLINSYRNTGYLPKWLSPDERGLMPGTLIDNVIAEAASKDIGSDLMPEFLEAMVKAATVDSGDARYGRAATNEYQDLGYVPADFHESVNQTLDNSLSDYSIGVVAQKLGKDHLANEYFEKSRNYRNLFDPETKFLWAKDKEGNFIEGFNPLTWGSPYTEGSAYQNSYNMYHDFEDFIEFFGGKRAFESRLDEISNGKTAFEVGVYKQTIHEMREYADAHFGHIAISNQPSFHLPYLYNYVDKPYKTQIIIKELLLNYFKNNFDGYPGDEDNGSLSAWYILSSLGFYPVAPGSNTYQLGLAFWDRAKVHLSNGGHLDIQVQENFHHKKFVDRLEIDGKAYEKSRITYDQIKDGAQMVYTLGIVPRA